MELSKKGSYTHNEMLTSWSRFHPNWKKKKIFVKNPANIVRKRDSQWKKKGKKKESLGGLFLQRIRAEETDNVV